MACPMQGVAAGRASFLVATFLYLCRDVDAAATPMDDETCPVGDSCQQRTRDGRRHGLLQIGHNLLQPHVTMEDPFASLHDEFDVTNRQAAVPDSASQHPSLQEETDTHFYVSMCQDLVIFFALVACFKLFHWKATQQAASDLQWREARYDAEIQEAETAVAEIDAEIVTPSTDYVEDEIGERTAKSDEGETREDVSIEHIERAEPEPEDC